MQSTIWLFHFKSLDIITPSIFAQSVTVSSFPSTSRGEKLFSPLYTRILFHVPQPHQGPSRRCRPLYREFDQIQAPEQPARSGHRGPNGLPRRIPCLIAGVICSWYHPYFNDFYRDVALVNYLSASLTSMEGEYPGCGFLFCGHFNRLNIRRLTTQFQLKQMVDKPTRGTKFWT